MTCSVGGQRPRPALHEPEGENGYPVRDVHVRDKRACGLDQGGTNDHLANEDHRHGAITQVEPPQHEAPDEQDVHVRADVPRRRVRREIVEHDVHASDEGQVIAFERIPEGGEPDHADDQRRRQTVQIHIEQSTGQHLPRRSLLARQAIAGGVEKQRDAYLLGIDRRQKRQHRRVGEVPEHYQREADRLEPINRRLVFPRHMSFLHRSPAAAAAA